ncbi:hypothetical protein HKCCE2091_07365 [Rhodobacterales bacterium HKCCE2091]|nr:hypothetical protein [Rhodobacterales bacterium HKCCE2091]
MYSTRLSVYDRGVQAVSAVPVLIALVIFAMVVSAMAYPPTRGRITPYLVDFKLDFNAVRVNQLPQV